MDIKLSTEVWLSGTGPSLDNYNWSKANKYRFGINVAAYGIPECFGAFAYDYNMLTKYKQTLNPNIIVFRKWSHNYNYPKTFIWTQDMVSQIRGTSDVAIQILGYLGVEVIHMVGFDSNNGILGHAKCLEGFEINEKQSPSYQYINDGIKYWAEQLKIKLIWEHLNEAC